MDNYDREKQLERCVNSLNYKGTIMNCKMKRVKKGLFNSVYRSNDNIKLYFDAMYYKHSDKDLQLIGVKKYSYKSKCFYHYLITYFANSEIK